MSSLTLKREEEVRTLLAASFEVEELRFEDFSQQHAGHNVQAKHGGSHVHLFILSSTFAGMNRVERSRKVHEALAPLLSSGKIHALTLKLVAPGESV